jgi:3-oxoacyl-[acyl-carrier-protein] synthase II
MLRKGVMAPCRNLQHVDTRCAPLDYVREVREKPLRLVMSNNFAFGGINTSLVLGPAP